MISNDDNEAYDEPDNDESYEPRPSRRRTRSSKRRKTNAGRPATARRKCSPSLTQISPPLEDDHGNHTPSLQPLLDELTSRYADSSAEDAAFEDAIAPVLDDCMRARREYLNRLPTDERGRPFEPLAESHEARLVGELEDASERDRHLPAQRALLLRKLKLQQHRRAHNLPSPVLRAVNTKPLVALPRTPRTAEPAPPSDVLQALHAIRTTPYEHSFLSRIHGLGDTLPRAVVSTDWDARAPWMELMEDVRAHYALKHPDRDLPDEARAPITYVTLAREHLPQVHDLLRRAFWDGVNVTDSLQYGPEKATIIATYRRLVVGCAFLSSPEETYITYLAVRAGWEQAQIATTMLYHLISRNPGRDITLHVSANNPAMLLYNRFGFKAEEFIVGFYADYLDPQARASKNAFRLRLRR